MAPRDDLTVQVEATNPDGSVVFWAKCPCGFEVKSADTHEGRESFAEHPCSPIPQRDSGLRASFVGTDWGFVAMWAALAVMIIAGYIFNGTR